MADKNGLFSVGTTVEWKYKGQYWKNGVITRKHKHEMVIRLYKRVDKPKEISLKMSDVLTYFYVKKTLKISNQIYPSWVQMNVDFLVRDSTNASNNIMKHVKIGNYRDGKSITFYYPHLKNEHGVINIKHKDIERIEHRHLVTKTGLTFSAELDVFVGIRDTLHCAYSAPYDVCWLIYEFSASDDALDGIAMYDRECRRIQHTLRKQPPPQIWPVNQQYVYGVEFQMARDIVSYAVEIDATFGSVKTWVSMNIRGDNTTYRGHVDETYDTHDERRRFVWSDQDAPGQERLVSLHNNAVVQMCFHISDGAYISGYAPAHQPAVATNNQGDFRSIKWKLMRKCQEWLSGDSYRGYSWYPFVRLLDC